MCRILVIDDEEEVRHAVARRLKREPGYEVETAESQAEGIRKIAEAERPYDLVVTDMLMEEPDSGTKVLKAAVMRDMFAEVIVLTAYGNVANAVECMRRGAFDYIEKNIAGVDVYDLLVLKIEQALDHRRSTVNTIQRLEQFRRLLDKTT